MTKLKENDYLNIYYNKLKSKVIISKLKLIQYYYLSFSNFHQL